MGLLRHPDQLAELHQTALVATTVEKKLRYLTIVHNGRSRVALADIDIDGTTIAAAGAAVIVAIDTANRDGTVFADRGELDINRDTRRHVAFGTACTSVSASHWPGWNSQVVYGTLVRHIPTPAAGHRLRPGAVQTGRLGVRRLRVTRHLVVTTSESEKAMKATGNQHKCVSSRQCVVTAPDVFDQRDEDGVVVLLNASPDAHRAEDVRLAENVCPGTGNRRRRIGSRVTGQKSYTDTEYAMHFTQHALRYFDQLYNGARRMTPTRFDAEDLVQETMLRAYGGYRSYRQGTNLRAWLFRIMYNTWVDDYRVRQRRPAELLTDELSDWQLAAYGRHTSVGLRSAEIEALEAMRDDEIADALDELPLENRMVVYLADVEGLRYQEIATLMNIPVGTVMSRLHRARRRLRGLLADVAGDRGMRRIAAKPGRSLQEPPKHIA